MAKTRVVVVDDSALVRSLLTEIINRQPDMECVGAAADPLVARHDSAFGTVDHLDTTMEFTTESAKLKLNFEAKTRAVGLV